MNTLARTGLVLFAALVVSIVVGASCVLSTGGWSINGTTYDAEATREEARELMLASGGQMVVELGSGTIRVRTGTAPTGRLRAVVRARGTDDADARLVLERVRLAVVDGAGESRVRLERTDPSDVAPISADLEIEVPSKVSLALSTTAGSIEARGDFASARVSSTHGAVAIEGVQGDLEVRSSSGRVDVARVAGERCTVAATHGRLDVSEVAAKEIRLSSSSGEVHARALKGDDVEIEATHGALHLASIEGRLRARTSSGAVRAERLRGDALHLASSHGSIDVRDAHGELEIGSSSGHVTLADIEGALRVTSTHGAVRADGVLSRASITTGSGRIDVRARPGSTLASDWSIGTTHGDVRVELPRDAAFTLDARTSHGAIDVGFEMLVPAGPSKKKSSVSGAIHGGGRKLSLSTGSGSISVQPAE